MRIAGTLYLSVNGNQLEVALSSVTAPLAAVKREPVASITNAAAGYKETPQLQYIKFTALNTPDFPLQALRTLENGNATLSLANGKSYNLAGSFLAGEPEVDGFEGTISLEFNGTVGEWA